jgi:hypothetical protein
MCTQRQRAHCSADRAAMRHHTPWSIIMEGPHFRMLSLDVMKAIGRLQALARSSPKDKQLLVETLKERGDIIGITRNSTNDGQDSARWILYGHHSSAMVVCAVHPLFARAVRLHLILMDHILCKYHWILPKTASVIIVPFSGPDCWRRSLPRWLPPTGSPV